MSENHCLVLFTKPARPGRVKTRLIGALSPEEAAELHAAFVADVSERLLGASFALRIAWALEAGEAMPAASVPAASVPGFAQRGDGLGARLFHGLSEVARRFDYVAAVGSDHPTLEVASVEGAFAALEGGADVVLGPARDGGYYLVAARAEALSREMFEGIPWSTERVFEMQRERCLELGLRVELAALGEDVDVPEDLERLAGRLRQEAASCPRTRELLESWGRL